MKYGPITPNIVPSDSCTNGAPFSSSDGTMPVQRHIIAVAVQMRIVSIKTESICTSPCLTGWLTLAAAAAFGAEPIDAELAHLDNRDWLFTTRERFDDPYSKAIAKSIVRLYNHTRNCIKIAPCANNTLLDRIHEQEARTGTTLAEYLAQARWIHLSSLSDFDQFEAIMQSVIQAKHLNPAMKVSMDPGFEYTSLRRERLQPLIAYADYVFLNK